MSDIYTIFLKLVLHTVVIACFVACVHNICFLDARRDLASKIFWVTWHNDDHTLQITYNNTLPCREYRQQGHKALLVIL